MAIREQWGNFNKQNKFSWRESPAILAWLTAITAIGVLLLDSFLLPLFHIEGDVGFLLSLTNGIYLYSYFWQAITYPFVLTSFPTGLTLVFLLDLFFSLYLLVFIGKFLTEKIGGKRFVALYLGAALFSAVIALIFMLFLHKPVVISGPNAPLIALLVVWGRAKKEEELFFFSFTIKIKWLATLLIAFWILSALSFHRDVEAAVYLLTATFAYLCTAFFWEKRAPISFKKTFSCFFPSKKNKENKIIDISHGFYSEEEFFIEAMLEKIGKSGKEALTPQEMQRLNAIAEKKIKNESKNNST